MRPREPNATLAALILLALAGFPTTLAHGGGMEAELSSDHESANNTAQSADDMEYPPTYFAHTEHVALLYAHIALMVFSWVFVLPIAVMLSLAKSRYTLLSQAAFTATNGLGIFLATLYNAQTPDLYPNNAHHSVGWVVTWISVSQVSISVLSWLAKRALGSTHQVPSPERNAFLPFATMTDDEPARSHSFDSPYRTSDDEGHGSGSGHSLRSSSASTVINDDEGLPMPNPHKEYSDDDEQGFEEQPIDPSLVEGTWARRVVSVVSSRIWSYVVLAYKVVDRVILPLGFIALTTGIVTLGRFFEGKAIFNGLAHWVKGGVFFWLGLFTLGRWSGSFGDLGWAWNIRPQPASTKWRPSAEFVESALIFFYGSTNVFMEHLGNWGGKWAPQDFEHLAITILFIGGGLCGMLIESSRIRDLLNVATVEAIPEQAYSDEEKQTKEDQPSTYSFSLNPIPALVILLLGVMMSSHHQNSMISTMVHKQWGNLLVGASFTRGLTYVLVFLRPPTSVLPSRPPTELLASFGLIAGGVIFMASSADTIQGMIHYDLDAMFMYTVTMGLVGLLMAWELVVLAIKGLATRSERRAKMAGF